MWQVLPLRPLRRVLARLASAKGFTLVETLATMTLLGIVVGGLTSAFVSASHAELDMSRRVHAQQEARIALDTFRREIHCASALTDTSGNALAQGTQYSAISISLGGYCPTVASVAPSPSATVYATWCTVTSSPSGVYSLRRLASASSRPACSASGTNYADYLTASSPFCLPSKTVASCTDLVMHASNALQTLHVTLPVNVKGPAATIGSYKLVDDIALRNSARS